MSGDFPLRNIKVSAPGKVLLFGEHAVVYGKTAVAASIDLRTTVTLTRVDEPFISIEFPNIDIFCRFNSKKTVECLINRKVLETFDPTSDNQADHEELLDSVDNFVKENMPNISKTQHCSLTVFFYLFAGILQGKSIGPFTIRIDSNLTIGSGTGSSASFAVAIAACLLRCVKEDAMNRFDLSTLGAISQWAHAAERIIHGAPSGVDTTICTHGGIVEFRKGEIPKVIPVKHKMKLLLIDTQLPRDTRTLVKKVAELRGRVETVVDNIMNAIDGISLSALEYFIKSENNHDVLKELTQINHLLLAALSVSHPALEQACNIARSYDAAAKLTGAGGGGFAFALPLPDSDLTKLTQSLEDSGFRVIITTLGGSGVIIEDY